MPSDTPPDPFADALAFGQRMEVLRTRRGMSRPALAGLLGMSPSWVKQVERGQIQMPKLPVVLRIAELLRVRDLADLTGDQTPSVELFIGPGHPRLPAVRDAVNALTLDDSDRSAPRSAHLAARLATAWSARHKAAHHRDVLGTLLPGLIRDAQLAVRQSNSSAERRTALATLSEVYALSQFFLAYQPDSALLWRVAERCMVAAQESEDPHAIGVAAWLAGEAHRDAAHFDAAQAVAEEALAFLADHRADGGPKMLAIAGALEAGAGFTAARRGDSGSAWGWWDRAQVAARALPVGYYHPVTSFSVPIMGAHAVTLAVELHAGGEAVRQAVAADATAIPSRPRLARHRIEEARAYRLDGQTEAALATLERAHHAAPETIRYNGYARRIVLEETESRQPARRRRAAALADQLGLLAA
ncbi:helix-turn-helix domain-containing protein [Streptomyces sp. JV186]|uniref:helix-turn-helix domain-containing protein n=1 Tax=Streptomyces TaxID=1883 RepID=UPI0007437D25|nr:MULTISPECIES: helix-turn-helix domain-containing protein [Streptomyces]KUL60324.1 XRE family transcriptional regulator [Streptomyces albidoflavus]MEE1727507.1 helix-turn-helix domain-containing protein [Streptomyces sp. JV186]